MSPGRVQTWNEWDPLQEIVVGRADHACFEPSEPGCRPKVRNQESSPIAAWPLGPKKQSVIDAANEQLDGLAALLERQGVVVQRPEPINFNFEIKTPSFTVPNMYFAVCPRDVMITIGQEVIEASMSRRGRFFEYLPYRKYVRELFREDPDMIWTAAPKPSMADSMYREEFWSWDLERRHENMHLYEFAVTQEEPVFDAADMMRFGRDVFVQESMTTNRPGIEWIRRHLRTRGIRVNAIHFPYDLFPSHMDCTFVPLRSNLVLTNPERPLANADAELFRLNGWEFIDAPQPTCSDDEMPTYCQSSKWLSMNVLSLGPDKVVIEEREEPLARMLEEFGFQVHPIPFRAVFEFGGSIHCATWDVRRLGECEDLFPRHPGGEV